LAQLPHPIDGGTPSGEQIPGWTSGPWLRQLVRPVAINRLGPWTAERADAQLGTHDYRADTNTDRSSHSYGFEARHDGPSDAATYASDQPTPWIFELVAGSHMASFSRPY
jgi:hypothetical protein